MFGYLIKHSSLCLIYDNNDYDLDDDNNFLTGLPAFLLYAARTYIKRITLGDHVETAIPLGGGLRNAIALDYDYQQNCIYWADITLDTIKRSFLNGSGKQPRAIKLRHKFKILELFFCIGW